MLLELPALPNGRYVLQWRALSTADGHTSQGTVSFAVGDPAAADAPLVLPPPPPDPLMLPSPLEVGLRWLTISMLMIALGSLIFGGYVWRAGALSEQTTDTAFHRTTRRLEVGTASLAALASFGLLLVASRTAEAGVFAFLVSSRVGMMLGLRLGLLILLTDRKSVV